MSMWIRKKDIAMTAGYGAGLAALVGLLVGTIAPDLESGGYDFAHVITEVAGYELTVALVMVVGTGLLAYGSDRFHEMRQDGIQIEAPDTLALTGAVGVPLIHEVSVTVGDLTTGVAMQLVIFAIGFGSYIWLARTP